MDVFNGLLSQAIAVLAPDARSRQETFVAVFHIIYLLARFVFFLPV